MLASLRSRVFAATAVVAVLPMAAALGYATARVTLAIAYESTGQPDRARAAIERACELDPGLNVDGIALNISAHPDPEAGRAREAILRRYWPAD